MARNRNQGRAGYETTRGLLENVARIFGGTCAAQQAMDDADAHDGPVRFYIVGNTILVEKLPKQPPAISSLAGQEPDKEDDGAE